MVSRRAVVLVLVALAVVFFVPSGSLSAATLDRGASVSVAPHENAALSIWDPGGESPEPPRYPGEDPVTSPDETVRVVVVENNFQSLGHVHVTDAPGSTVEVDATARNVRSGKVAPVRGTVNCNGERGPTTVPIRLTFVDAADSIHVVVEYDVTVRCAGSPDEAAGDAATNGRATNAGEATTNATASNAGGEATTNATASNAGGEATTNATAT